MRHNNATPPRLNGVPPRREEDEEDDLSDQRRGRRRRRRRIRPAAQGPFQSGADKLGENHRKEGKYEEAEATLKCAIHYLKGEEEFGETAPALYRGLAMTQCQRGDEQAARRSIRKCLALAGEHLPETHRDRILGLRVAARIFSETSDPEKAAQYWQMASQAASQHDAEIRDPECEGWGECGMN